jgi:hypothetical protein
MNAIQDRLYVMPPAMVIRLNNNKDRPLLLTREEAFHFATKCFRHQQILIEVDAVRNVRDE